MRTRKLSYLEAAVFPKMNFGKITEPRIRKRSKKRMPKIDFGEHDIVIGAAFLRAHALNPDNSAQTGSGGHVLKSQQQGLATGDLGVEFAGARLCKLASHHEKRGGLSLIRRQWLIGRNSTDLHRLPACVLERALEKVKR